MTVLDRYRELNPRETADREELTAYRATGLSPVEVRALNNMLTIMRTFITAVDSVEFSLSPLKDKIQEIDEFWRDFEP